MIIFVFVSSSAYSPAVRGNFFPSVIYLGGRQSPGVEFCVFRYKTMNFNHEMQSVDMECSLYATIDAC